MRVRHLAKQQVKRDKQLAALPPPPLVLVRLSVVSPTSIKLSLSPVAQKKEKSPLTEDADYKAAQWLVNMLIPAAVATDSLELSLPWSDGFALVTEQGWASPGVGHYHLERFQQEEDARLAASKLWCCWVLYQERSRSFTEIASGGFGLACYAVRRYVEQLEKAKAEDQAEAQRMSLEKAPAPAVAAEFEAVELDPAEVKPALVTLSAPSHAL